jgi:hypothetical protein
MDARRQLAVELMTRFAARTGNINDVMLATSLQPEGLLTVPHSGSTPISASPFSTPG